MLNFNAMKKLFFIAFFISSQFVFSQKVKITDFSKDFYAEISPAVEGQILKVFSNKNKKELISTDVHLSEYDLEDTKSNISEIPYGHQSIIIFDDFNFDGKKDIAIKYGNESCYGGPSYEVYLFENNTFEFNTAFSDLAQNYCGFFSINKEKKQLNVMTKSGCCWHQYSDFIIKNNKPFLVREVEEQLHPNGLMLNISFKEWKDGKYIESTENLPALENQKELLSYQLSGGKRLILFMNEDELNYFFLSSKGFIELHYDGTFFYSKKENSLSFENNEAQYKIFNNKIIVKDKGKSTTLSAISKSKKGNISAVYQEFKEKNIKNLEVN